MGLVGFGTRAVLVFLLVGTVVWRLTYPSAPDACVVSSGIPSRLVRFSCVAGVADIVLRSREHQSARLVASRRVVMSAGPWVGLELAPGGVGFLRDADGARVRVSSMRPYTLDVVFGGGV